MTASESSDDPSSAQASDSHRQLANFRDLGGLRLVSGGVSQSGVLYRGDAPSPGGPQAWLFEQGDRPTI